VSYPAAQARFRPRGVSGQLQRSHAQELAASESYAAFRQLSTACSLILLFFNRLN
jgi:hypothetical protein